MWLGWRNTWKRVCDAEHIVCVLIYRIICGTTAVMSLWDNLLICSIIGLTCLVFFAKGIEFFWFFLGRGQLFKSPLLPFSPFIFLLGVLPFFFFKQTPVFLHSDWFWNYFQCFSYMSGSLLKELLRLHTQQHWLHLLPPTKWLKLLGCCWLRISEFSSFLAVSTKCVSNG